MVTFRVVTGRERFLCQIARTRELTLGFKCRRALVFLRHRGIGVSNLLGILAF